MDRDGGGARRNMAKQGGERNLALSQRGGKIQRLLLVGNYAALHGQPSSAGVVTSVKSAVGLPAEFAQLRQATLQRRARVGDLTQLLIQRPCLGIGLVEAGLVHRHRLVARGLRDACLGPGLPEDRQVQADGETGGVDAAGITGPVHPNTKSWELREHGGAEVRIGRTGGSG